MTKAAERKYQLCRRCVMDTSDPAIHFDAAGVCDHCRTWDSHIESHWITDGRGARDLDALAARIRAAGQGRAFDCIIGVSGGIDSSYLTYIAKEQMGLRPLVFHVDAGWNSQEAVNNIDRLIDGLELDLFTKVIDWEEMRDLQLAFFRSGVPHIDTPQDHAFFATMYRFVEQENIPYILTGANYSTECVRNPLEWMYYQSDATQILDIHRRFGERPLRSFPLTSIIKHKVYLPYLRGIRVVHPLNLVPYNKSEAMRFLATRFGWEPYPQKHFESRFTKFYEGYWLPRRFGYDTRRVQFSSLILTRQMTRVDALKLLEQPPLDEASAKREFEYVAAKLRISPDDLQSLFELPRKTFRDYRSQYPLYVVGARVMRLLGLQRGGKR